MRRNPNQSGFADAFVVGSGNARLQRIEALLDWSQLDAVLGDLRSGEKGRPGYPARLLLKVLLLQVWYELGDPAMEEALEDRLSFRHFVGLRLGEAVPDHSTISRFRSALVASGRWEGLLAQVNAQLDAKGLVLRKGTLIDATLIEAAAKEPPKQAGGGRSEADPDARWMKQANGRVTFGYKLHLAVDQGSHLVRGVVLTPANVAEITVAPELVQGDEAVVMADKAYASQAFRDTLKAKGIKDRIQHRASKSRRLTARETLHNRLIGRIRGRIEGVFGALKRSYGLARMRYMGLARNALATTMTVIAWNLARAADALG